MRRAAAEQQTVRRPLSRPFQVYCCGSCPTLSPYAVSARLPPSKGSSIFKLAHLVGVRGRRSRPRTPTIGEVWRDLRPLQTSPIDQLFFFESLGIREGHNGGCKNL